MKHSDEILHILCDMTNITECKDEMSKIGFVPLSVGWKDLRKIKYNLFRLFFLLFLFSIIRYL